VAKIIGLPSPRPKGKVSVEEAISKRRSVRQFLADPLTAEEISQLLWAAQGITEPRERLRAAPSAGALYPLETYVATGDGLFHYDPARHRLQRLSDEDPRPAIHRAALEQESILEAGAVFLFAAVFERTERHYGPTHGRRYVFMDVGHAAENLLLEAVALGLGAVPIGAFHEGPLHKALNLPRDQRPVYLVPVGRPRRSRR
jgi:SagB-type dehydrogenase family enzyme